MADGFVFAADGEHQLFGGGGAHGFESSVAVHIERGDLVTFLGRFAGVLVGGKLPRDLHELRGARGDFHDGGIHLGHAAIGEAHAVETKHLGAAQNGTDVLRVFNVI